MAWHEGDVIRKLRIAFRWTLADLAGRSGVNFTVINRIELGKTKEPKRGTLKKVAGAFGWTSQQLVDAIPVSHLTLSDERVRAERLATAAERKLRKPKRSSRKVSGL